MKRNLLCLFIALVLCQTSMANDSHQAYFKALQQAQALPSQAQAITPASKKTTLQWLKNIPHNTVHYHYRGDTLQDKTGQHYQAYVGHFSNLASPEIMFTYINGGSLNTSGVKQVFRRLEGHLVAIHYDQLIKKNLLPGKDLSSFYLFTATPFAYTLHGQTYLRYLLLPPHNSFNPKAIHVCTYHWYNHSIKLVTPSSSACIHSSSTKPLPYGFKKTHTTLTPVTSKQNKQQDKQNTPIKKGALHH